ncbi:MAG: 2-oxo acid dehydrogenase subunit E2 [Bacteroidales bacterium]|nr:2-oxo acid dehydrogenase subunit E2 [Bacteroidales bacterium]MCF8403973.1 2-oxo acid dehydrogenase subunit E2 [Bacteroidales bacterium]
MALFEIIMPKLGESIIEATITKWLVQEGDSIAEDDPLVEIATDKVDSEIPSPVEGSVSKIHFKEGDVVPVGAVIALVDMDDEGSSETSSPAEKETLNKDNQSESSKGEAPTEMISEKTSPNEINFAEATRFFSPLVKNIAKKENISLSELNTIPGSGKDNRVTKKDILQFIEDKKSGKTPAPISSSPGITIQTPKVTTGEGDEIIEMDRMRKLIADHMVMSKHTSPHVTMFHEVDMTKIVVWRNKNKETFQKREGEKLTFTPIFIEAAARALRDFPLVNASVDGYTVIKRKNVNIGMATALPNGNLIVPVIKNADQKNLAGLAKNVNDLANRARGNKLNPDEISGGTFTITNFGQFGNLTGAPIINQPQVAILGVGTIIKKPAVIETPDGDLIGIREKMILSLAFDHRIVDGALGGMFLQKVAHYLEEFDTGRTA